MPLSVRPLALRLRREDFKSYSSTESGSDAARGLVAGQADGLRRVTRRGLLPMHFK